MTQYPYATSPWARQRPPVHTPARLVVAPTGGIIRGFFPSAKARRMVPFEQLLELDALYLFEFAPQVVDIREQPFKLQYAMDNKVRRYTPDYALILRDGDILIVEVKPSRSLAKPEVREKLQYIHEAMVRQGHQFIVLSSDTIRMPSRLDNLKRLHRFLRLPLPNSSISQCKRVDVWTWQEGVVHHAYLDVQDVQDGKMIEVPEPQPSEIPSEWRSLIAGDLKQHGTLVVWSKLDRITWKQSTTLLRHTEFISGRVYRHFINDKSVRIRLT